MPEDVTPAEPGAGDVEALIRQAWHESGFYFRVDLDLGWLDGLARITADALAAHDAEVRRETGERIAQAIEADVDRMRMTGGGIYTADFAAGTQYAARIAREEASRG